MESAARVSGARVTVVLVAARLELDDNTTCSLYTRHRDTVTFYTVDIPALAADTPLGEEAVPSPLAADQIVPRSCILPRRRVPAQQQRRGTPGGRAASGAGVAAGRPLPGHGLRGAGRHDRLHRRQRDGPQPHRPHQQRLLLQPAAPAAGARDGADGGGLQPGLLDLHRPRAPHRRRGRVLQAPPGQGGHHHPPSRKVAH